MSEHLDIKPEDLAKVDFNPPKTDWMDTPTEFRKGTWSYPGKGVMLERVGMPNPRTWSPMDEDWQLPEDWKEIILKGLKDRLDKYRSLRTRSD